MACKHGWQNLAKAESPQTQRYHQIDWCNRCGSILETITDTGDTTETIHVPRITKIMKRWVREKKVSCAEALRQSDGVNEDLPELTEKLCKIVGYYEP